MSKPTNTVGGVPLPRDEVIRRALLHRMLHFRENARCTYVRKLTTLEALQQALEQRTIAPGLVHHSDRGVQYASQRYTDLLKVHRIQISMSRRGNPYDNALAESLIKTLKYEEVHLNEYETFVDAYTLIEQFLEAVYNHKRLHSALDYRPPAEFEQALSTPTPP